MKLLVNITLSCLVACTFLSCHKQKEPINNIILLIGDGMGATQVFAGYTANKGQLALERAQFVGFSKTSAADNYITDSGAGGTAIATGSKTNNGAIAMDTAGKALSSILESAEQAGLATALVSTSAITHATPASFIAHNVSRYNYEDIAADFIGSGVDLFIGGGRNHFEKRADSINLSDKLRAEGYAIVYNLEDIAKAPERNTGCFIADEHPASMIDGRDDFLPKATNIALQRLSNNPNGFFVMIEGSQIDWGGHAQDIDYVIEEMLDFDQTVGYAFDFADTHPGTLVIVTADHETGGLSIIGGDISKGTVEGHFSTAHHTPVMVPVFTYGTGAEDFSGIYENTELYVKMMKALGLGE